MRVDTREMVPPAFTSGPRSVGYLTSQAFGGPSLAFSMLPGEVFDIFSMRLIIFSLFLSGYICIGLNPIPYREVVGSFTFPIQHPGNSNTLPGYNKIILSPLHPRASSSTWSLASSSLTESTRDLEPNQGARGRDYTRNAACRTTRADSSINAESTFPFLFQLLTDRMGDNPIGDVTISSSSRPDFFFFLTCLT